ncbi:MAG: ClpXP protease specificity-enhancing factor SspB [Holosporaceae bacterium]|jgi:hypothetical protein|nr:ClpXP protease specificity-enhancing factor SspB [Holosporaceae bacterium]
MNGFKYDELVQKALISVVKEVLGETVANGLPGNHHFYIRFRTDHPKVEIPNFLRERHPEEVMIVIQYQFWDLKVFQDKFCVDLSFNGVRETLRIPFSALTAFVDPSVKFALQFSPSFNDNDEDVVVDSPKEENKTETDGEGKIISFDSFRKK